MVTGNVYYFFKNEELPGTYYSATIKIRSNSTFYDRLHFILGKLSKEKLNPDGIIRTYHSYHNEDHYIFEVENIIDSSKKWVHGDRIRFYSDQSLNITKEIRQQFTRDAERFQIEQLKDLPQKS